VSNVASLDVQRKKHDDGRCHEPGCPYEGNYRYVCPFKGQHPHPCPHTETYVHHYKLHGFLDSEITKCKACHQAVYPDVPLDWDL
jgi:hypothetical protein